MKTLTLILTLAALISFTACGDDGPGDSDEELCCACVSDNACGNSTFSFGACVPDGYAGLVDVGVDSACVEANCAVECQGASFIDD